MNALTDYILRLESHIPAAVCDAIIEESKELKYETHRFYDHGNQTHYDLAGEQELSISFDLTPSHEELRSSFYSAIDGYCSYLNSPFLTSWNGFTMPRLNRYEPNQKMAAHIDHIHDMFDGEKRGIPILSIVAALNDQYTGGEFVFFDTLPVSLNQGDILLFPSNFMYPHHVKPVTKGIRHTAVSWVW